MSQPGWATEPQQATGIPSLQMLARDVPFSGIAQNYHFGIVSCKQKSGRNHSSHPVLLGNCRKSLACSPSPRALLPGGAAMPFPSSVILIDIRAVWQMSISSNPGCAMLTPSALNHILAFFHRLQSTSNTASSRYLSQTAGLTNGYSILAHVLQQTS